MLIHRPLGQPAGQETDHRRAGKPTPGMLIIPI